MNVTWLKRAIDLRLKDINRQDWLSDVNENGQCLNYRIFKDSLDFEPYLVKCNNEDSRNVCKFRCGSNRLPIISGRYEGIPRSSRLCTLCSVGLIGDEFHYMFQCEYFTEERKVFIPKKYINRPNTLKMNELFNTKNMKVLFKLAKFVKVILQKLSS